MEVMIGLVFESLLEQGLGIVLVAAVLVTYE